jgi:hypothetical protein
MRPTGGGATPSLDDLTDHRGDARGYVTDGVELYRYLGPIPSAADEMIAIENCRTLDVALWPIDELRARQLRAVTPAAQI